MNTLVTLLTTVVIIYFTYRYSEEGRSNRLERINRRLDRIDSEQFRIYGPGGRGLSPLTHLDYKKARLEEKARRLGKTL